MNRYQLFFLSIIVLLAVANETSNYFQLNVPYKKVTEICDMVEFKSDIDNAVEATKKNGYKVDFDGKVAVVEVQSCTCVIGLPHNDFKGVSACRG